MPRREASPNPWRDCKTCGWRNYAQSSINTNPVRSKASAIVTWTTTERCGGCGEPLRVEPQRPEGKWVGEARGFAGYFHASTRRSERLALPRV